MAVTKVHQGAGLAFGVDPSRPQFYSLRQARYEAVAQDISAWAGAAATRGETFSVLDVGCGWGVLLAHLRAKPHVDNIVISAADIVDTLVDKSQYERFLI